MITAAVLDAMLAAGCTADQIVAAVKASLSDHAATRDERDDRRRELAKARQQRRRDKLKAAPVTRDVTPRAPAHVEDKSQPTVIEPRLFVEEDRAPKRDVPREASPRHVLESVLDVKHAAAVIDHRQRLRKPLTAHAADLLARKLALCRDPNAAADLMIEKGWQSIEPEWMENRNGNGSRNAPRGAHNGGDSRGSRLMRAFGLDAEVERGRGDGPTIDGHAAERSGD